MVTQIDLSKLLNAELYSKILTSQFPWPRNAPLNWHHVIEFMLSSSHVTEPNGPKEVWYPVLRQISTIPVSGLQSSDLMRYLPNPDSDAFPRQALALQVLLDQGPRMLFSGNTTDIRFVRGYFDILSLKLALDLRGLPEPLGPWRRERWSDVSFEYWTIVWFWLTVPMVHSEFKAYQESAKIAIEMMRMEIESRTGKTDPFRKERDALEKDTKAFSRMLLKAPSEDEDLKMEACWWWWMTVMDVHKPIIDHFGKYPYANGMVGRASTEEEIRYQQETDHFAEPPPKVQEMIKDDVEKGIWTPLG